MWYTDKGSARQDFPEVKEPKNPLLENNRQDFSDEAVGKRVQEEQERSLKYYEEVVKGPREAYNNADVENAKSEQKPELEKKIAGDPQVAWVYFKEFLSKRDLRSEIIEASVRKTIDRLVKHDRDHFNAFIALKDAMKANIQDPQKEEIIAMDAGIADRYFKEYLQPNKMTSQVIDKSRAKKNKTS